MGIGFEDDDEMRVKVSEVKICMNIDFVYFPRQYA